MTTGADREIVPAEGALAVVATGATRTARGSAMVQRDWRGHLRSLRQTRPDLVTLDTRQPL